MTRAVDAGFAAAAVAAVVDEMVDTRRDLHAHPELSLDETRTTAVVRERLEALGLDPVAPAGVGPNRTGAVFDLAGSLPGATVVLRADIDALPVVEAVDLSFRSQTEGVMHACGHDVHTAALLGVARVLAERREGLAGRYRFVFQPAEELLGGGKAMVEAGALDGLAADARLIGFHATSVAPAGVVALRPGVTMSEVDSLRFTLTGTGGHGAVPGAGNVITAVTRVLGLLESVVAGQSFEGVPCVCTAGQILAGTAPNVVPVTASVQGTLRTFTPEQRAEAIGRLRVLCDDVGAEEGVTVDLELWGHAPRVVNDEATTAVVRRVAEQARGADAVVTLPPVSPSDDVSELLAVVPGCYFFVGGALADGSSGMHHSPTFALDEEALVVGATVMAGAAVALAGEERP